MSQLSSRRRFLGYAALQLSAGAGLTAITTSQAKAAALRDPRALVHAMAAAASSASARSYWPTIIIGTGYGGAVSALRLGQAGQEVLMLEMGQMWNQPGRDGRVFCSTLKPDGRAMWFKKETEAPLDTLFDLDVINSAITPYAGVLDRVHFGDMSIYAGRGVGGGSLVNGGMAVTPRADYFAQQFPQVDVNEMYAKYFPRANATLGAATIPPAYLANSKAYKFTRVGRTQAADSGFKTVLVPQVYDWDYMQAEEAHLVPRSALAQEILYGNNHGKRSLDKTYLAEALGTGNVTIQTLTKVSGIRQDTDGSYVLSLTQIDAKGKIVGQREVSCGRLMLGAGSMGTSELLLRARDTGAMPNLPEQIGQGWGPNGNVMTTRFTGYGYQTGALQSTMPCSAIDNWDDPRGGALVEITPMPFGFEASTLGYLGVTKNPERASFSYNAKTDGLALDWTRDQALPSVQALKRITDKMNRTMYTSYRDDLFAGGKIFGDNFCYHPLGGCVLGQATDAYGAVNGYSGLYVTDGSLVPGSIGVNPFVTISALAERNIEHLISTS